MKATVFADLLVTIMQVLEFAGEDKIDGDFAVDSMEHILFQISKMDKESLQELVDALQVVAPSWGAGKTGETYVRQFAEGYGILDMLWEDEPEKLAELEAQREARGDEDEDDET